jgi:hypothetical protein
LSAHIRAVEAVRAIQANRLRSKTTVNHNNTRTTRLTDDIAQETKLKLQKIAQKILAEIDTTDTDAIRQKYGIEIGSIIATAVRQTFELGHSFIETMAKRTIILTEDQVRRMNQTIDIYIESFWRNVDAAQKKDAEKKTQAIYGASADGGIISSFLNFVSHLSTSLSYQSLNQSTISTYQQFNRETRIVPIRGDNELFLDYPTRPGTTIPLPTQQAIPALLMWVSERDGRVCPICLNLDGRTFNADDPDIPTPGPPEHGGTSHWGCRCRVLPEIAGKIFNA